jgi:hypothetical protein
MKSRIPAAVKGVFPAIVGMAALVLLSAPSQAQTETLTFDALGSRYYNASSTFGVNDYSFAYLATPGAIAHIGNPTGCSPNCSSDGHYAFYSFNTGSLGFGEANGAAFSLYSLDAAQTFTTLNRALDITITGTLQGGGTVSQAFTEPNGSADSFNTFTLPSSFRNLVSVSISGAGSAPLNEFAVNNIVVTAAVPEPSSYALVIAGLGLVALAVRRRRAG